MESLTEKISYDEIYMELWELAQRYYSFVNFRVIGNSHDDRMIPMLEVGKGKEVLFCVSGMTGNEIFCVYFLMKLLREYCILYEKQWEIDRLYNLQELLDKVRLCVIPVANPDGYEIARKGYQAIRNPVLRQMLRMQEVPFSEYEGNGRNVSVNDNFPLKKEYFDKLIQADFCGKYSIENETKALMNIFTEYTSLGLIHWSMAGGKIIQYKYHPKLPEVSRNRRIAGHLKRLIGFRLELDKEFDRKNKRNIVNANCGQYYAQVIRRPAFRIDIPELNDENSGKEEYLLKCYNTLKTIPLEFIFSI